MMKSLPQLTEVRTTAYHPEAHPIKRSGTLSIWNSSGTESCYVPGRIMQ